MTRIINQFEGTRFEKKMKKITKNMQGNDPPNKPEKHIPAKPDVNPDPTKIKPGGNEPGKIDPTRIAEPGKIDPTRIGEHSPQKSDPPKQ